MRGFVGKILKIFKIIEKMNFSLQIILVFGNKNDDLNEIHDSIFYIRYKIRHILSKVIRDNVFTTKPFSELKNC